MGAMESAYEIDSVLFDVVSSVVPVAITIAGIIWAHREFTMVIVCTCSCCITLAIIVIYISAMP